MPSNTKRAFIKQASRRRGWPSSSARPSASRCSGSTSSVIPCGTHGTRSFATA